jgi:hypothetical protein
MSKKMKGIKPLKVTVQRIRVNEQGIKDPEGKWIERTRRTVFDFKKKKGLK